MPQSLSCVLVHFVFSTKNRQRLILPEIEADLHAFLGGIFRDCGSPALTVGGAEDHVHILSLLAKTMSQSAMMEEAKTRSSKWIKRKGNAYRQFYWQSGYGAFSIARSKVAALRGYIARQKQHHR
mgnify:CR=1 FL=1